MQEAAHAWAEACVDDLGWVAIRSVQRHLRRRRLYPRRLRDSIIATPRPLPGRATAAGSRRWRSRCKSALRVPSLRSSLRPRPRRRIEDARMTYCIGLLLDNGLVMIADTRTNAGRRQFLLLQEAARADRQRRPPDLRRDLGQPFDHPGGDRPAPRRPARDRRQRSAAHPRRRAVDVPRRAAGRRGGADRRAGRCAPRSPRTMSARTSSILLGGRIGDDSRLCS